MFGRTISYGQNRGQVAELWRPKKRARGDRPVVVLIHGGFWRGQYTKVLMRRLAKAVTQQGWVAWNVEYRRLGLFGGGGGWPNTFSDVAAAVDHLAAIGGVDLTRVVTCGHSAGGHLAFWAAARGRLPPGSPGEPMVVPVRAAISLAGIVDLPEADRLGLGAHAVAELLGSHWDTDNERYQIASPASQLPLGVPQVLVHGVDDRVVPCAMSATYQARASAAGDRAEYVPIEHVGHRALINPNGPAWRATVEHIERLMV